MIFIPKERKSAYDERVTFLFEPEHPLQLEDVSIRNVASTFYTSSELATIIHQRFEAANMGEDGKKWRYEKSTSSPSNHLEIAVSPIDYSEHFVLRKMKEEEIRKLGGSGYPAAFTVNTLQLTEDNRILIARRSFGSDQKGLASLGSGFCDRYVRDGITLPPSNPFLWNMRECVDEADYAGTFPFNLSKARFLGLIKGENTDVTAMYFVPLIVGEDDVSINPTNIAPNGKPEHDRLLSIQASPERFLQFLNEKGMNGISAPGHLTGGIELLLKYKDELQF
jgi:hypothetical protein